MRKESELDKLDKKLRLGLEVSCAIIATNGRLCSIHEVYRAGQLGITYRHRTVED